MPNRQSDSVHNQSISSSEQEQDHYHEHLRYTSEHSQNTHAATSAGLGHSSHLVSSISPSNDTNARSVRSKSSNVVITDSSVYREDLTRSNSSGNYIHPGPFGQSRFILKQLGDHHCQRYYYFE